MTSSTTPRSRGDVPAGYGRARRWSRLLGVLLVAVVMAAGCGTAGSSADPQATHVQPGDPLAIGVPDGEGGDLSMDDPTQLGVADTSPDSLASSAIDAPAGTAPAADSGELAFDDPSAAAPAAAAVDAAVIEIADEPVEELKTVQVVYDAGVQGGWKDAGWSPKRRVSGGTARFELANGGGWLITGMPTADTTAIEVTFRTTRDLGFAPFVIMLGTETKENIGVAVPIRETQPDAYGWSHARIPIVQLNPQLLAFTAVRFSPSRALTTPYALEISRLWFTTGGTLKAYGASISLGSGAISAVRRTTKTTAKRATTKTTRSATALRPAPQVDADFRATASCTASTRRISPLIYGIGWNANSLLLKDPPWGLGATVNRWGGNATSTYNFIHGNLWNTSADWFFRNVNVVESGSAIDAFLAANAQHGVLSAVTVPTLGWVAKDATSYSFPVSVFGAQQYSDPDVPDAGNGRNPSGSWVRNNDPSRAYVASSAAQATDWVRSKLAGRTTMYFLDNEPELWDSTHADVHPEAVGYDEELAKTIEYAQAIRRGDPNAVIAGPSSWGWTAYLLSGLDMKLGWEKKPDRKAHGDVPFLEWYLSQVRAYEKAHGIKLLDLLDVHFYPQGNGIFSDATDAGTAARRIRSTRALWDPKYKDESWIDEPVYLVPRLRSWIDKHAPGLGISIGEWNFGGEQHMSGALAVAEALGHFGVEGVTSAYYWTAPPTGSPAYWAFRGYRNFDGRGGRFLEYTVPVQVAGSSASLVSVFASRSANNGEVVLMLLNESPTTQRGAEVALTGCGQLSNFETYRYTGAASGFVADPLYGATQNTVSVVLPPYSISVVRARMR